MVIGARRRQYSMTLRRSMADTEYIVIGVIVHDEADVSHNHLTITSLLHQKIFRNDIYTANTS